MQFWNEIINTALLGTEKKQLAASGLPTELHEAAALIAGRPGTDQEEQFLQLAAVALNFRQSGMEPRHQENIVLPDAPAESSSYCSDGAVRVLRDVLSEDNQFLWVYWLQKCSVSHQLAPPELLPILLNRAVNHVGLRADTLAVCGQRGTWLTQFNPSWQFSEGGNEEELWQTGTADQRKRILLQMRRSDPARAREMLLQSWAQENANSKAQLLTQLAGTVTIEDQQWLESLLLSEKGQKVKEEVLNLLKQMPGSSVLEQYWQIVREAVTLKKEKGLLGIVNKTVLQIHAPAVVPESVFKTGIEKLSDNKAVTDEEFILMQMMRYVPPAYWETHLALPPEAIIGHFQKEAARFLTPVVSATVRFKDARWALSLMQHSTTFYIDVIPLLPPQQQEFYSIRYCEKHAEAITRYASQRDGEWSVELTKGIFKHTAKNPYQYNISFYKENIRRLPAGILAELEKCSPSEAHLQIMWSKCCEQITRLIGLKEQINKAFNE